MANPITWTNEKRMISELKPAAYNPRTATEKEESDLCTSLEKFSLADPIIINRDNTIIGGHFRLRMLERQGVQLVDVRVPKRALSLDEEKELNLRLNKNLGRWDWEILADFNRDLLNAVGFSEEELLENFGLSDAEMTRVDPERMHVITVEAPEAPRLESRHSFYFDDKEEFERIVAFFQGSREGHLDIQKLRDVMKQ